MKSLLLGCVSAIAIATTPFCAFAQQSASTSTFGLEEIVVTAQKREERLQTVPLSVSAITAVQLERYSTPDLRDLTGLVPNVYIQPLTGGSGIFSVAIRGIQISENEKTFEAPVGTVLDGVYLATPQGSLLKAFDLERIEVLRGPQGTLFGKNTTGGAINAVRTRPTGEWGGKVNLAYGTFNRRSIDVLANAPIIDDVLAVKGTISYEAKNGVPNIIAPNRRDGDSDYLAGSLSFLWTPSSDLEFLATYDHIRDRGNSEAVYNIYQSTPTVLPTNPTKTLPADTPCRVFAFCPPRDFEHSRQGTPSIAHADMDALTLQAKWTVSDNFRLVSIFGARATREGIVNDFDATELLIFEAHRPDDNTYQASEELRAEGELFDERLSYVAGLFYFDSGYRTTATRYQDLGYIRGNPAFLGVRNALFPTATFSSQTVVNHHATSYAAFAQGDVKVTDALTVTGGFRYTEDRKHMIYRLVNPDGTTLGPAQGASRVQSLDSRAKWDEFTPHASIKYQFEDVLVYGSYTKGYNTGGYSGRAPDVSTAGPYNPETVNAFEVGIKSEWFDNRLRVNAAVFHNSYKNKQEEVSVATTIPPFFGTSILNVSSARIQGLELEVTAVPAEGLTLSGSLGYLDAKYTNFNSDITGQGVTNNSGLSLRRAPEINGSLGMDYTHPLGSGDASGGVRMRYQGDHELALTNDPLGHVKASAILDATLAYAMTVDAVDWRLSVYGRNLTDQIVPTTYFRAGGFLAFMAATRGTEFGIELKAKF